MLKLIHSKTINVNVSIFQNDKGEYWGIEQNLHNGHYNTFKLSEEDLQYPGEFRPDILSDWCPKVGENPTATRPGPDGDCIDIPASEVEKIFGKDQS